MCKEVGVLDYGRRGLHEGGGNCVKYLKRGWNRKEGRENKDFQGGRGGGKPGQGVGTFKRREARTPLRTMLHLHK